MQTHEFEEIRADFLERVNQAVYCCASSIDRQGRPRSRILHPIWEGNTGWITTSPTSLKAHHLERNPYLSLGYIHDPAKPVYVDCVAEWINDRATKQYAWDLFLHTAPPLGFDPGPIYGSIDEPKPGGPTFGLLKLTPYRILLYQFPIPSTIWTPAQ
jgi:general stress protein 26